jgi:hypothetical protein
MPRIRAIATAVCLSAAAACAPAPANTPCPAALPVAGTSCPSPDPYVHSCEYGGDSNTDCTTLVDCAAETLNAPVHWIVTPPDPSCGSQTNCPATSAGVHEGAACMPNAIVCLYPDAACGCLPCFKNGLGGGYLHCRPRTDVAPGCPTPRPRLGDPCGSEGLTCDYGQCCRGPSLGPSMACHGGYWRAYVSGACACAISACP